jgi:hypothetical protein
MKTITLELKDRFPEAYQRFFSKIHIEVYDIKELRDKAPKVFDELYEAFLNQPMAKGYQEDIFNNLLLKLRRNFVNHTKDGFTPREYLIFLAQTCEDILKQEGEYQEYIKSEERFIEECTAKNRFFTEDGKEV